MIGHRTLADAKDELTIEEAAKLFEIPKSTIYRWAQKGMLRKVIGEDRLLRVLKKEVAAAEASTIRAGQTYERKRVVNP